MSYTINYDFNTQEWDIDNRLVTLEYILGNKDLLIKEPNFINFCDYNDYKITEENKEGLIEKFENSDFLYDLEADYTPMVNYLHILQNTPTNQQVEAVIHYAPTISIIYIDKLDTYCLGLRGCGMDLSEYLELAYYIIDGISPIKARNIMSLSDEAKELLEFCRKTAENYGNVAFCKIQEFLKGTK